MPVPADDDKIAPVGAGAPVSARSTSGKECIRPYAAHHSCGKKKSTRMRRTTTPPMSYMHTRTEGRTIKHIHIDQNDHAHNTLGMNTHSSIEAVPLLASSSAGAHITIISTNSHTTNPLQHSLTFSVCAVIDIATCDIHDGNESIPLQRPLV